MKNKSQSDCSTDEKSGKTITNPNLGVTLFGWVAKIWQKSTSKILPAGREPVKTAVASTSCMIPNSQEALSPTAHVYDKNGIEVLDFSPSRKNIQEELEVAPPNATFDEKSPKPPDPASYMRSIGFR